jgi:hypothetical protein
METSLSSALAPVGTYAATAQNTPPTYDVYIEIVINGGKRGDIYRATHYGDLIVDRSRQVICDSARHFAARGIKGRLAIYRTGSAVPCAFADIEAASMTALVESPTVGPKFGRYQPFNRTAITPLAANQGAASE